MRTYGKMEQHPDDPIQHENTPNKRGGIIYQEKQKRMLCAIHAIHNLLQINPFLTTMFIGLYDV